MSETISLAELQVLCSEHEGLLRAQNPDGSLPVDIEGELASMPPDTVHRAISRLALLKHAFRVRWEQKKDSPFISSSMEAREAARQLVRREPIVVPITGREIEVTGRSYAAIYQIAAHWGTIQELEDALETSKSAETSRRIYAEILLHRRAIWAHALTPSGAPADRLEDGPTWWSEITPQDDAVLLAALFEVMHNRYARLGPLPDPKDKKEKKRENFGWHSLLMTLESKARVEPASYYDRDLFQLVTRDRLAAQVELEEALEG